MNTSQGVCYIAFGDSYMEMALRSVASLRRVEPSMPVIILTDEETGVPEPSERRFEILRLGVSREQNRAVKTQLPEYVPYQHTLYLDADTVILRPIRQVFRHLESFDLCAAFCGYCVNQAAGHLSPEDKTALLEVCPGDSLHFQCGVFCWKRNSETLRFFREWNREWKRFQKHDQGAFARAVWRCGVRLGVLWRDEWNALSPTLHVPVRIMHYANRKQRRQGDVFPQAVADGEPPDILAPDPQANEAQDADIPSTLSQAQGPVANSGPGGDAVDRPLPSLRKGDDGGGARGTVGICYVAYGDRAYEQACRSLDSLREFEPEVPVTILTDRPRDPPAGDGAETVAVEAEDEQGNSVLTQVPLHVGYDRCLVLAADTQILQPVSPVFAHLEVFDLCLAFDPRGVLREARDLTLAERTQTFALCTDASLFYESGVLCWKRTASLLDFYRKWHEEWTAFGAQVEGALARAVWRSTARIGVLWPGIWNHSKRSEDLRILRSAERFPEIPGSAVFMPLAAQAMAMRRREALQARRRVENAR